MNSRLAAYGREIHWLSTAAHKIGDPAAEKESNKRL